MSTIDGHNDNPRLTLEKINGKAARNLLGFDLSGVSTNSLTSATLVLSIDPSDQVTGWGNGETVSVKPVTVAWQEGNGKKHGLPVNQQTAGSGAAIARIVSALYATTT